MEKLFKNLTVFEFHTLFPDDQACIKFLADKKWQDGFVCPKCGHDHSCQGINELDRQCTRCRRLTSPTSGTIFHRLKFSPLKAMYIVYAVITNRHGVSSSELSRKLGLRQKTCWAFLKKVETAIHGGSKTTVRGNVKRSDKIAQGSSPVSIGNHKPRKAASVVEIGA